MFETTALNVTTWSVKRRDALLWSVTPKSKKKKKKWISIGSYYEQSTLHDTLLVFTHLIFMQPCNYYAHATH